MPEGGDMPHTTQEVNTAELLGSIKATLDHVSEDVSEIKEEQKQTTNIAYSAKRKAEDAHRIGTAAINGLDEVKKEVNQLKLKDGENKWFWKFLNYSQPILLWSGLLYLLSQSLGVTP